MTIYLYITAVMVQQGELVFILFCFFLLFSPGLLKNLKRDSAAERLYQLQLFFRKCSVSKNSLEALRTSCAPEFWSNVRHSVSCHVTLEKKVPQKKRSEHTICCMCNHHHHNTFLKS